MANSWKRQIFQPTASVVTSITGSIFKVCSNGAAAEIHSASFGWQNQGTNQLDPGTPVPDLSFALHYHTNAGDTCVEADFSYISCSVGTHVYLKTNGSQGWQTNVS